MKNIFVLNDALLVHEHSWETHIASMLSGYIDSHYLHDSFYVHDVSLIYDIKAKFKFGQIQKGDKFIITNALSGDAMHIRHLSEHYKIPVEIIGFWSFGLYVNHVIGNKKKYPKWRITHERVIADSLTTMLFISDRDRDSFIDIHGKQYLEKSKIIAFPLDYIPMELSQYANIKKHDSAVIFYPNHSILHEQIILDIRRALRGYQFFHVQETDSRQRILSRIAECKVAIFLYDMHNSINQEIYECLNLNTIPISVYSPVYERIHPDIFYFSPEWISNILNYAKHGKTLTSMIKDGIVNHEDYMPAVISHRLHLFDNYYNSEHVLQFILQ